MSLYTNLVSAWRLDEASGTRADCHGTNHLTDNNTVTQAVGKIGNAAEFLAANTEYLSIPSNSTLQTGSVDFTIATWVYMTTKAATQWIVIKDDAGSNREFVLFYDPSPDRFRMEIRGAEIVSDNTLGSPSINTWYFLVGWRDHANSLVGISTNAGTAVTAASGTVPIAGPAAFQIGRRISSNLYTGRIDQTAFWKSRVLSAADRNTLHNSGNGLAYESWVSGGLIGGGNLSGGLL